jgi:adenosylcobinamide-GDP ribazoletransferase
MIGSLFTLFIVSCLMLKDSWIPIAAVTCVTALSGLYYFRRLGGVTGDCFGATNQLAEIAVYFCGVWVA